MPSITACYCALLEICPAFVQRIELDPVETLLIDTNPRTRTTLIERMEPMKGNDGTNNTGYCGVL